MSNPRVSAAGGFAALAYVLEKGRQTGYLKLYRRLRSKNTCKTCAVGMGGQHGGMVNEAGHFPEVCKKSVQAQAADMLAAIPEEFFRSTPISALAELSSRQLDQLGRLTFPVIAEPGAGHFRRIGWDDALDRTADGLNAAQPEEVFFYASGRSSNEAAFLMQLVARAYGTANIHNCSYYCHQASGVALGQVYGSGTSSVALEDLATTDLAVVVGANPASNHPRLITQLVNLRRGGGRVIVINPLKELGLTRFRVPSDVQSMLFGSDVSDLYLQPHIGGDVALFKALLKGLLEVGGADGAGGVGEVDGTGGISGIDGTDRFGGINGTGGVGGALGARGIDDAFVTGHTAGWAAVREDALAADWAALVAASGVPKAQIDAAVRMLVAAKKGIFMWAMGLTHHTHGVDNILAMANVALARGWLGRPGAGLLPIRGHSNVQGVGSMGVGPKLKDAFAQQLLAEYGIDTAGAEGMDTYSSMVAAHAGGIKAAVLFGGNLFASNPDRTWAAAALRRIPLTVAVTTKLNEGHIHGRGETTILLPALARDEESQSTTQESMFNYVRLSEGGSPAVEGEMRSEVEIVAELAERILPAGRFDWPTLKDHGSLRAAIAKVVPGFTAIGAIDESGREFQIDGRTFHEPRFDTPDGKAHFQVVPLPERSLAEGEFWLMTIRSEGQFNTVVYEEEDLYRGNLHRNVVMMAASDAAQLGLAEGESVVVESEAGRMTVAVAVVDIRAGNLAMYYPEANLLVPQRIDARSKTPAFKSVAVRVRTADTVVTEATTVATGL